MTGLGQELKSNKRKMKNFKVICKVDRSDGKGIVEHTLYIKAEDANDAEKKAKYYWILEQSGVAYYGVKSTPTEI